MQMATGDLGREIMLAEHTAQVQDHFLSGRETLHIVYQFYATRADIESAYFIHDLDSIILKDDAHLYQFYNAWQSLVCACPDLPPGGPEFRAIERIVEDKFIRQIRKSKTMASDLGHYYRYAEGTYDHSYAFLIKQMKKHLERVRHETNREKGQGCAY